MAKVKIDRKSQITGKNLVKVDSVVSEEMDYAEYKAVFSKWSQEASQLQYGIEDLKRQLTQIGPVKNDPEVKKLKEMLVEAEKMKARDELQAKIQELELMLERKKEDIAIFQPNFIKIQKAEKEAIR